VDAATFEPHLGTEFRVAAPDGPGGPDAGDRESFSIRLDEVVSGRASAAAPRPDPFSLEFTGPQPALDQRIHTLDHPSLGSIQLFLVPIGVDPDGRVRYEAVFN
jgi:hypothetical protein